MPLIRDSAVVLRTHKLGEADRIIVLMTEGRSGREFFVIVDGEVGRTAPAVQSHQQETLTSARSQ